ncbi:hypothetical protein [Kribbella sindirgiensis]|uniref:Uncharacterized protein n=1 Tax=Kribbella sindirgiensis TaxID=1124744 RepID=A0A4R0IEH6_9ACTN|nr:hypothetical protein [Kribbella sindirgiensis]TCC23199.1 hypothetical protein E0H50_33965 [Kribbella sindirgiensis]
MTNSTPEIPGYQFDQRILLHPLAEMWHGRTFTGTDVIALVLSEEGARNPTVVDRLTRASRGAALEPGRQETPLWAANFASGRPYAITQLVHGETGAERLVDPLDGVLGNDDESLEAVRNQLVGFGATPPVLVPGDNTQRGSIPSYVDRPEQPAPEQVEEQQAQTKIEIARQYRRKIGAWIYGVVAVAVLIVFSIAYSIGTAIGGSVKEEPAEAAPPPAVNPEPIASSVLIPPIHRVTTAPYKRSDGSPGVFGATYPAGADVQVVANAELPFAIGWPRPPQVDFLGESSQLILRRIVTSTEYDQGGLKNAFRAQLALHPCASLAKCLSDRTTFDQQWTQIYKTTAPAAAKDARTWLTVSTKAPYTITMTRAFQSGGQWWLVGAMVYGQPGEAADIQRLVNDIWRQTA